MYCFKCQSFWVKNVIRFSKSLKCYSILNGMESAVVESSMQVNEADGIEGIGV